MNETTSDNEISVLNSDASQIPKKKKAPEISKNDSMSEAARKILSLHFKKMLKHETGTRIGKDNEELHDMRVAAMRMRSAFKVFNDYLDMDTLNKPLKKIKRTRKKLGSVRDLDVFMEKIEHYLNDLPDERKSELNPLIDTLNVERDKSRGNMLIYLESNKYHKFVKNFSNLLEDDGVWKMSKFSDDGKPVPYKVKDVLPILLHQQLATVRAYDEWVNRNDTSYERLHQLRIDIKTLRYTLEFFNGVLGPESKSIIKDLKRMQDHLGELHDTVVAIELLEDFLKHGTWGESGLSILDSNTSLPGVESYLEFRNKELNNLVDTFPEAWNNLMSPVFSNRFSSAIAELYNNDTIPNNVVEN
ncbi:MAG: CHAD domain-containing protein [Methanohalobium sp.]|uniref:CHAD domain-containing protein n=1 Tax=Methanohalobium sp. TaxID=2837493 RepID=UPI00397BDB5A